MMQVADQRPLGAALRDKSQPVLTVVRACFGRENGGGAPLPSYGSGTLGLFTLVWVAIIGAKIRQRKVVLTRLDARAIHVVADRWYHERGTCPTVEGLVDARELPPHTLTVDRWRKAFRIECSGRGVSVVSAGPDGVFGTRDDVRSDEPP